MLSLESEAVVIQIYGRVLNENLQILSRKEEDLISNLASAKPECM